MHNAHVTTNTERYIREIVDNQNLLTYHSLLDKCTLEKTLYHKIDRFGLSTIAIKNKDLLHHQLLGIMSFRLSEYLKLDWIDPNMVYQQKIFHEPLQQAHCEDIHLVTMNHQTGEIICYLCIYSIERYKGLTHLRMETEDRPLFPCEIAHGKHIFNKLEWLQSVPIHSVREIKRFVKSKRKDTFGHRVSLELLAGLAYVTRLIKETSTGLTAYVGDLELTGAFRHIQLLGLDVTVIENTRPELSNQDLFYRMYEKRKKVLPFVIQLPQNLEEVCLKEEMLTKLLEENKMISSSLRRLVRSRR